MTNLKTKELLVEQLEIIGRSWPFVPEHVRPMFVELISNYGPKPQAGRFPIPSRAKWSDVEILLTDHDRARITVAGVSKDYTLAGLGPEDKRRPGHPRREWRMLKTYAENPQPDAYHKLPHRKNLKLEISRFRRWLKEFFGIPGDPLKPFKSDLWLPKFKIGVDYAS